MTYRKNIIVLFLASLFIYACTAFPGMNESVDHYFENSKKPDVRYVEQRGGYLGYNIVEREKSQTLIVFIHGSPGTWKHFAPYLGDKTLQETATLMAVDRPGYGWSKTLGVQPSMKKQADLIWSAIDKESREKDKVILVGHSIGPAIALRIAMDHPERVGGLMLISGAVDPHTENRRWYQAVASWPIIRRILPRALRKSRDELTPLKKQELEAWRGEWSKLKSMPMTAIHGDKDWIVPYSNLDYIAERTSDHSDIELVTVPKGDHFILWNEFNRVLDQLLILVARTNSGSIKSPVK